MRQELWEALDEFAAGPGMRVGILTGATRLLVGIPSRSSRRSMDWPLALV